MTTRIEARILNSARCAPWLTVAVVGLLAAAAGLGVAMCGGTALVRVVLAVCAGPGIVVACSVAGGLLSSLPFIWLISRPEASPNA